MYYLLDKELNLITPLETYQSVIWTSRYYECGDFELYIPATAEMLTLIKKDFYIIRDTDFTQAMIIQNIQITTDAETGNFLIVTGKDLKSILNRRIIWNQTTLYGSVEKCIRQLINENIINPTLPERKIDNFILGVELGETETIRVQYTGDNLGEVISNTCMNYGLGYDVLLDFDEKQFVFILYKGLDRSYNQKENQRVIFSKEYENLLTTTYAENNENFKNVALVAGEGEGIDRKTYAIGTASGMDRLEMFVDSRNTSSNNDEISEEEYNQLLYEEGKEALNENIIDKAIEGDVEANHTWQLNKDYFIGDIVEVINEYGISMQPRIIEIIENEDDSGKNTVVTFATENNKEA